MKTVCLQKNWTQQGYIAGYFLQSLETGATMSFNHPTLLKAMQDRNIEVINLKLSRGTIVDKIPVEKGAIQHVTFPEPTQNVDFETILSTKVSADKKKLQMIEQQEKATVQGWVTQIHMWKPRIQRIIDAMEKIRSEDPKTWDEEPVFPNVCLAEDKQSGSYGEFNLITEMVHHRLGAYESRGTKLYLGIRAGGACGNVDFYTDGEIISYNEKKGVNAFGLSYFVKHFEEFEKSFTTWFCTYYKI